MYITILPDSSMVIKLDSIFKSYMSDNNISRGIFFEFCLPYCLHLQGAFDFIADKGFFTTIPDKKRKVIFNIQTRLHNDQKTPTRESTVIVAPNDLKIDNYRYGVMVSILSIFVESFPQDDIPFDELEKKDDFSQIIEMISQSILEFILFKYNETNNGCHTITPSYYDCSHLNYYRFNNSYEILYNYLSPNVPNIGALNNQLFQESLNKKILVWKEFLNEAIYSDSCCDYKKSLIYAPMSIESLIYYILSKNNIAYNNYFRSDWGKYPSLYNKIKLLIDSNYIYTQLNSSVIKKNLDKITRPRNDLLHGKITNLMSLKNKSNKSILALNFLLEDWNFI